MPIRGYSRGGGAALLPATHGATAVIAAHEWAVQVEFTNPNATPMVVGLALSGTDAGSLAILPETAGADDIDVGFFDQAGSPADLAIPASGAARVWIARATGVTGAVVTAQLDVAQPDASTTTVTLSAATLSTLLEYAGAIGFTSWWSFPSSSPLNDQIGTAHLTGAGARAAAEIRGAGGVWTPSGAASRSGAGSPGRNADGAVVMIWEHTAATAYPQALMGLTASAVHADAFVQVTTYNGTGVTVNDPTDTYTTALKIQGPGAWVDTGGISMPDISYTPLDFQGVKMLMAINFDHATGKYTSIRTRESGNKGIGMTEIEAAVAVGTASAEPASFQVFASPGLSLMNIKCHALGFKVGGQISSAEFKRIHLLSGINYR